MQAPQLRPAELREAMAGCNIGGEIEVFDTLTSTNDAIHQRLLDQPREGLTIFGETQTAGRGRFGNSWESAAGKGLWFSILLRPGIAVADSALLTSWAASAVRDTLLRIEVDARIKPPNDVFVGERKIAGVLVEMCAQSNGPHVAILGIGLNVNHEPADFSLAIRDRVTSVARVLGREIDRTALAVALLRELNDSYGR